MITSRINFALAVALTLLSIGCKPPAAQSTGRESAPEWTLPDMTGKPVKSSDYLGKVVVLDFWATWCPPCRDEIPGFIALQNKYGSQGLVVLGVDVGPEEPATVEAFVKKIGINYTILASSSAVEQAFGGVEGIPTTFIIDRKGRIVARHVGFSPQITFEKEITPLLKEKP